MSSLILWKLPLREDVKRKVWTHEFNGTSIYGLCGEMCNRVTDELN